MSQFVHLRLHTEYSLVDGIVRVPELMAAVSAAGMPAVALTDQSNLFAMVKFYKEALSAGVKPLIGVDAWIREAGERAASRIVFLCQDLNGYRHLTQLVTRSFLQGQQRGAPMLERSWLQRDVLQGLIVLSGGAEGDVGQALVRGRDDEASRRLAAWQTLCGDRFYLEVQRTGRAGEDAHAQAVVELAREHGVAAVATNDVRFLTRAEFEAHEARVCIHDGALLADPSRARRYSEEQYLKSPAEMSELFADAPELLENTVEVAKRCSLQIRLGASMLPAYPVPAGCDTEGFLRAEAARGLVSRLAAGADASASVGVGASVAAGAGATATDGRATAYEARLELELGVICSMGFAGYFLIVADFIRWARDNGVPVGPGRGSGAGSLVAYVLGITDLDPIEHDLLFERFLNPERVSMPDFDMDFCMEGRDRVIEYVANKYGRERVSQIITYGTLAAKAVVRDVGRVLGHNYGYVDKIAKLIPFEIGITLDKALEQEEELKRLYEGDSDIRELIDLARSLEGLARNAGTHAGGVVIAPSVLTDFTPLYCEEGSTTPVTQFDKDDVEAAGLVKFDFLGLRTLTIIDWAVRDINVARATAGEAPLAMNALPMDDAATYQLLKSCKTTAVFQLESRGMKDLIRRLQPDRFGDIVALVALFRPGPLQSGMVEDFIARKHDTSGATIDYLHPDLKPVLEATYGVILYQEQVMQIAQILAGYTLGGADLLRRAMGKKKAEEMAKQRSVFVSGAVARGVREAQATHIFDLMEKFAGYGFNKSHSAAYAVLSYQTAWLKAHYPAAFMAAVLSSDMDKTDKVVTLIDECAGVGLTVLPPDVNESVYAFHVSGPMSIRYGMGAIKGVGASAVEAMIEERTRNGPYASLPDLCRRIDLTRVNRRVFDALIRSGSLDRIGPNRATLTAELDRAMHLGEQNSRAMSVGQVDLFGLSAAPDDAVADWTESQRLAGERETLGLFLSGHPITPYEPDLKFLVSARLADVGGPKPAPSADGGRTWSAGKPATVAGLVLEIRRRPNRVTLILDDRSARLEVSLYEEIFQQHRDIIVKDAILIVDGTLRFDDFIEAWRLQAKSLMDIDRARERYARRLWLKWPAEYDGPQGLNRFEQVLKPHLRGPCGVSIAINRPDYLGRLNLGSAWSVHASRALLDKLTDLVGRDGWYLVYGQRNDVRG
ncbi:MAG TPA: DNA polymerase III subunit alpha, partial [Steroidobacteraceae bacterium]|nr:DNA polymerase III subunit alpha [Steroidobacteraceae bacterium]